MNRVFILIGASSELSESFQNILVEKEEQYITISRSGNSDININSYEETEKIIRELKNYSNLYIVFFNGFLAENRPKVFPSYEEIVKTDYVNFIIPYFLTRKFKDSELNIYKFIYISSMAAIKPRRKNYIYGLSKFKLEKSIAKLLDNYLIFRFGQIDTKMSKSHANVPLSLSKNEAAMIIYNKIEKKNIVYSSLNLRMASILIYFLPLNIIDLIEKRLTAGE